MHRVPKLRQVRSYKSGEQRVALSDIVNLTVPDTKKPKSNALQSAACCQLSQQMGMAPAQISLQECNNVNIPLILPTTVEYDSGLKAFVPCMHA